MQRIRVTQPAELLAAVPYLIGFHPSESLVLIGIQDSRLHFAVRADLDECRANPELSAHHLASVFTRQHNIHAAVIIGYGPAEQVNQVTATVRRAVVEQGMQVAEILRVTDGRFYSADCPDPRCCPPEGRAFRPDTSVIAAEATLAGYVALPDRATLVRQLAPVDDLDENMAQATDRAEARLIRKLEQSGGRQSLVSEGADVLETALSRYYCGNSLTDDEVAWLSVATLLVEVRDAAWHMIEKHPDDRHIALWTDVVRRAQPGMVAPAATLLAYAAYLSGQGSLASIALERSRTDDPDYPMAQVLHDIILRGLPPHRLRRRTRRRRSPNRVKAS